MEETNSLNNLVAAATEMVNKHGVDINHTVAASVAASDGRVFTALNLYHFTGGPCAEISALASAVSAGAKDLTTIVAVGNNNRGVLAPCGRCRQVIFDYYPNMKVGMPEGDSVKLVAIKDLLPGVYDWNEHQPAV